MNNLYKEIRTDNIDERDYKSSNYHWFASFLCDDMGSRVESIVPRWFLFHWNDHFTVGIITYFIICDHCFIGMGQGL
jgi:hypothetical protein